MVYTESSPAKAHIYVLAAAALLCFLLNLGIVPVNVPEALVGITAAKLHTGNDIVVAVTDRGPVRVFPLAPWTSRVVSLVTGGVKEWSLRLPSVAAAFALAFASYQLTRREAGRLPAFVAAGATITAVGVFIAARAGDGRILFAAFIATAWVAWYIYGRLEKRWATAWCFALLLVLLGALAGGAVAFAFFYFPLLFLRSPFQIWRKLRNPLHLVLLGCALLVYILWRVGGGFGGPMLYPPSSMLTTPWFVQHGYGWQLVAFPVGCAWLALPWLLLAWPGFCAAYRPLEKTPALASFLRTLLVTLFLACWAVPNISPMRLLPLVVPLGSLAGLHYEILVRRHHRGLRRCIRFVYGVVLGLAMLFVASVLVHATSAIVFREWDWGRWLPGVAVAVLLPAIIKYLLKRRQRLAVWSELFVAAASIYLLVAAAYLPLYALARNDVRRAGERLRRDVPADAVVHKLTNAHLFPECYYLHRVIRLVASPSQLPDSNKTVYVLHGERPPILETRVWEPCSPPVVIGGDWHPAFVWNDRKRSLGAIDLGRSAAGSGAETVRMYCGVPREPPETD